uniref:RNA-directed DNA polymerase, eukaryota n=1 Tax=Tanacetum cinerariifolium TaxID=118510 RepID=A0A6L2JWQ6_TANCI|nr:RNA-directed DNA polymerase, eukaryota [Tanacetum cinerariifolium]
MSDRNFHNSYENQTQKISKSVFVTNFPEDFTARDLWKVCSDYGTVVDVFIPFKRSKSGKRFAFDRFIKGEYVEWEDADLKSLSYDQDDLSSDGESQEGDVLNKADNNESDVDRVSESSFMHENDTAHKDVNSCKKGEVGSHSDDPFNIYDILGGQKNNLCNSCSDELKFPHGFNPDNNDQEKNVEENIKDTTEQVDKLIDQGKSNDEILIKRVTLLNDLQELNNRNTMEISQKAKIRWSIEGDENSKYFYGIMNKKRSQPAIRGTLANGEWISEPHRVKNEFFTHFKKQFSPIQAPSICFDITFLTRLSSDQVQDLEHTVTYEEVKMAIWDCGTNKSLGPDGFSFEFYRKYWTTIDDDVFQAIMCSSAYLISDVQFAFVANRQILDGPFILNELLSWCKFKKLNGMIFKVDFKKAFDYVKWDYFSSCLNNAMGSVLVNNSPTLEFQFHNGLNQGGRLSLLKSALTSISLHHMYIFKVPIGVLNHLESIRRNFFYGVDGSDRKLAWIGWNMVQTSKKNGGLGEVALKVLYKRLYALEMCKSISVAEKMGHPSLSHFSRRMPRGGVDQKNYDLLFLKFTDLVLPNISDRWCWYLEGSQEFLVKSSRILIDNTVLPKAEVPTRWLRVVSIKVNVHAWRVYLDKLPTRANISLRGMDIPSIACPLCNSAMESSSHIFSLVLGSPSLEKFFNLVGT